MVRLYGETWLEAGLHLTFGGGAEASHFSVLAPLALGFLEAPFLRSLHLAVV